MHSLPCQLSADGLLREQPRGEGGAGLKGICWERCRENLIFLLLTLKRLTSVLGSAGDTSDPSGSRGAITLVYGGTNGVCILVLLYCFLEIGSLLWD